MTAAVGYHGTVAAADTVTVDGQRRIWSSWSDAGAQVHTVIVPSAQAGYPATCAADTTRPQTTIASKPDKVTTERRATFAFTADEPTKRFECKIDNQWWWDICTSPYTTRQLSGTHTFYVRAVDLGGLTDLSTATYKWTVIG